MSWSRKRLHVPAGTRYGLWTVLSEVESRLTPAGRPQRQFLAQCTCGNKATVVLALLRHTGKSCGYCTGRNHGMARTPTYGAWVNMRDRCQNPNNKDYRLYGGRGIAVCTEWQDFRRFYADMGERPDGLELDRIDNNRNYEPSNCRWTDRLTQVLNCRHTKLITVNGAKVSTGEACRLVGRNVETMRRTARKRGWTHQQAIDHFLAIFAEADALGLNHTGVRLGPLMKRIDVAKRQPLATD